MPQLDFANYPFISQIFWLLTSFIILYISVSRIILPRISQIIEQRDISIRNALENAENLKNEATSFVTDYEESYIDARKESEKIMLDTQKQIKQKTDQTLAQNDKEIETKISDAEKNIKSFLNEQSDNIEELSTEIYNYLIKKHN
jgi:F-type H+-transporting ATPase subunit b